jgi:hypothetical protein
VDSRSESSLIGDASAEYGADLASLRARLDLLCQLANLLERDQIIALAEYIDQLLGNYSPHR